MNSPFHQRPDNHVGLELFLWDKREQFFERGLLSAADLVDGFLEE